MPKRDMFEPASRVEFISKSEIRNMTDECERRGGINLSQGVCDLPLSDTIEEAACDAIRRGVNAYTHHRGLLELRTAIARKAKQFNRIPCTPENVIVSAGATGALYCAVLALLSPGDEVIIFEPYYGYHVNTLLAVDAVPVYARLSPPNWDIDFGQLESVITPRTRAVLVNTPANPSGKVFSFDELNTLARICEAHDLFVLTDEIYEYFTYDGYEHVSPAAIPALRERTITVSGFSKVFSITGWRIGYCIAPPSIAQSIGHVSDLVYVCSPAPLQAGVAKALDTLDDDYYLNLKKVYRNKRDRLCDALTEAGLSPCVPQGAYYVLASTGDIPGHTSKEKAMWLLDKAGVASVPGCAFYQEDNPNELRFCFAKDDSTIASACRSVAELKV